MYGASAVLADKLYLFGGWGPGAPGSGGEFLDDVWELDTSTNKWPQLNVKLPFPVSRHTACTVSTKMGDAIVLHTFKGIIVFQVDQDGSPKLTEQDTTGNDKDSPKGLSMCAVSALASTKMLLFGGSTRTQQMSQDAYVWTARIGLGQTYPIQVKLCLRYLPVLAPRHWARNKSSSLAGLALVPLDTKEGWD